MESILQIRDSDGNIIDIPALQGNDGYTPQKGIDYFDGEKGDPFTYEDFTPEQLEALKGADGYTPQKGIDYFDGEKGDPFTYDDFTPEQLESLKGKDGKDGVSQVVLKHKYYANDWTEGLIVNDGSGYSDTSFYIVDNLPENIRILEVTLEFDGEEIGLTELSGIGLSDPTGVPLIMSKPYFDINGTCGALYLVARLFDIYGHLYELVAAGSDKVTGFTIYYIEVIEDVTAD
jgi:hypothetical protein